uniref:Putative defensin 2 n=1 Tax=Lutzomyia longipalpis TaxID=7200 RepID=A0A7G3AGS4_LUTLO
MRALLISFAVVVVVGVATAYPSTFEEVDFSNDEDLLPSVHDFEDPSFMQPEIHSRQKRATCDLLSAFGVGHAACAAHCIGHGFRGGYCDSKAVCRCRR